MVEVVFWDEIFKGDVLERAKLGSLIPIIEGATSCRGGREEIILAAFVALI
jgi:hypothetical protein